MRAKKITLLAILVSQAMVLSFFERFLPLSFAVPGAKLGLANIVTLIALKKLNLKETFLVVITRVILSSFMFGSLSSLIYSLFGAVLAMSVMAIAMKLFSKNISIYGISILGAVFHNVGQILAASLVLDSINIFYYLPMLLIAAIPTGFLIGLLSKYLLKYLDTHIHN
jgi:heptaprenyl diphosphate synthase